MVKKSIPDRIGRVKIQKLLIGEKLTYCFSACFRGVSCIFLNGFSAFLFLTIGSIGIAIFGADWKTYGGFAVLFSITLGSRWVNSCPTLFSYKIWPALIPCYFMFCDLGKGLFHRADDLISILLCMLLVVGPGCRSKIALST